MTTPSPEALRAIREVDQPQDREPITRAEEPTTREEFKAIERAVDRDDEDKDKDVAKAKPVEVEDVPADDRDPKLRSLERFTASRAQVFADDFGSRSNTVDSVQGLIDDLPERTGPPVKLEEGLPRAPGTRQLFQDKLDDAVDTGLEQDVLDELGDLLGSQAIAKALAIEVREEAERLGLDPSKFNIVAVVAQIARQIREGKEVRVKQIAELAAKTAKAKAEFVEGKVELPGGEFVDADDFAKLTERQQKVLKATGTQGLAKFAQAEAAKFEAEHVKLDTGEFVKKSEFDKLDAQGQDTLRSEGVEAFNAQQFVEVKAVSKPKEQEVDTVTPEAFQNTVLLSTGERVDRDAFLALSRSDQAALIRLGVERFTEDRRLTQAAATFAAIAPRETLTAPRPEEIPPDLSAAQFAARAQFFETHTPLPDGTFVPNASLALLPIKASTLLLTEGPGALNTVRDLPPEQRFAELQRLGFIEERAVFAGVDEESGGVQYTVPPIPVSSLSGEELRAAVHAALIADTGAVDVSFAGGEPSKALVPSLETRKLAADNAINLETGEINRNFLPIWATASAGEKIGLAQLTKDTGDDGLLRLELERQRTEIPVQVLVDSLAALTPVVGTVHFWERMGPFGRTFSVATDVLAVSSFFGIPAKAVSGIKFNVLGKIGPSRGFSSLSAARKLEIDTWDDLLTKIGTQNPELKPMLESGKQVSRVQADYSDALLTLRDAQGRLANAQKPLPIDPPPRADIIRDLTTEVTKAQTRVDDLEAALLTQADEYATLLKGAKIGADVPENLGPGLIQGSNDTVNQLLGIDKANVVQLNARLAAIGDELTRPGITMTQQRVLNIEASGIRARISNQTLGEPLGLQRELTAAREEIAQLEEFITTAAKQEGAVSAPTAAEIVLAKRTLPNVQLEAKVLEARLVQALKALDEVDLDPPKLKGGAPAKPGIFARSAPPTGEEVAASIGFQATATGLPSGAFIIGATGAGARAFSEADVIGQQLQEIAAVAQFESVQAPALQPITPVSPAKPEVATMPEPAPGTAPAPAPTSAGVPLTTPVPTITPADIPELVTLPEPTAPGEAARVGVTVEAVPLIIPSIEGLLFEEPESEPAPVPLTFALEQAAKEEPARTPPAPTPSPPRPPGEPISRPPRPSRRPGTGGVRRGTPGTAGAFPRVHGWKQGGRKKGKSLGVFAYVDRASGQTVFSSRPIYGIVPSTSGLTPVQSHRVIKRGNKRQPAREVKVGNAIALVSDSGLSFKGTRKGKRRGKRRGSRR